MFSFKNDPNIKIDLFEKKYGIDIFKITEIKNAFDKLIKYKLISVDDSTIKLTAKGRLCVEEICCLFKLPHITQTSETSLTLRKHNFSASYDIQKQASDLQKENSLFSKPGAFWNKNCAFYTTLFVSMTVLLAGLIVSMMSSSNDTTLCSP